jgi:hypothetical protein
MEILWRGSDGNLIEGPAAAATAGDVGKKPTPAPPIARAIPFKKSRRVLVALIVKYRLFMLLLEMPPFSIGFHRH